jgi:hypothetical protein
MRLTFSDIRRPKAAAKQLSRLSQDVSLAKAHEALARATGYRDWHELAVSLRTSGAGAPSEFSVSEQARLASFLADELCLETGDVQFALSKARLVGASPWSIADQIAVYMASIREKFLGSPARGKPGIIVKVKAHGSTKPAYLLRPGRPTYVLYDSGEGACADYEAIAPRTTLEDFLPARMWLPYGSWILRDGSEVLFSRDYLPLWRVTGGISERLDPWLWIKGRVSQRWFAANTEGDWWRRRARESAITHLEQNRIFELPKLANAMPRMFEQGVASIQDAVRRMYSSTARASVPAFAALNSNLLGA